MALKDWKTDYNPWAISSMSNGIEIISINTAYGFEQNYYKKIPTGNTFAVDIFNEITGRSKFKYFKTKAQAMKFARAYMRKH